MTKPWDHSSPAEKVQSLGEIALAMRTGGGVWALPKTYADKTACDLMPLVDRFVHNCKLITIEEGQLPNERGAVVFKGIRQNAPIFESLTEAGIIDHEWRTSEMYGHRLTIGGGSTWVDSSISNSIYEVEAVRYVLEKLSPFNSQLGGIVPVILNGEVLQRAAPTPQHPLGSLKIGAKSAAAVLAA